MSGETPVEPGLFGDEEGAPSPFSGGRADEVRASIGRPKGARNRKSVDMEKWYFAKGYVDPVQRLGELVSEDPRVLVAWFDENAGTNLDGSKRAGPSILEVVRMQIAAAGELMPYLHGKMPTRIEVTDERLPALLLALGTNQLDEARQVADDRALSAGRLIEGETLETPANPGLSEGEQ